MRRVERWGPTNAPKRLDNLTPMNAEWATSVWLFGSIPDSGSKEMVGVEKCQT